MIHDQRIQHLNRHMPKNNHFILYWMQASQRTEYNHALNYAIDLANTRRKPLIVYFGFTPSFPEANLRHYHFMIQGLKEVNKILNDRKIKMIIRRGSPEKNAVKLSENADCTVVDRGYLKIQKQWRQYAARHMQCPLIQVESDVIVPVETVSEKEEYSAATIRRKIYKILDHFLVECRTQKIKISSTNMDIESLDISALEHNRTGIISNNSITPAPFFKGGTRNAKSLFRIFTEKKLDRYGGERNDPGLQVTSDMSPYLHFGQISSLWLALNILSTQSPGAEPYLEQLIVRRELAINFVHYNPYYDSYNSLPEWCHKTLREHSSDKRDHLYSVSDFENAKTHDPYWNAAQTELVITGKMHNYMRMYWAKKILEWSPNPEQAYRTALHLNNIYELDGRDANGFAGIAWCFGKHDRPWAGRQVFGNIRYMGENGLKRKFDMKTYIERIDNL